MTADHETNTAPKIPASELEQLARQAGMETALFCGSGSCVWTAECNGVTQECLERFAELVTARALAAPAPAAQGAIQEPVAWLILHTDNGAEELTRIRQRADLARRIGHKVTALAPVGQAEDAARQQALEDDAARYRWLRSSSPSARRFWMQLGLRTFEAFDVQVDAARATAQQAGQAEPGEQDA